MDNSCVLVPSSVFLSSHIRGNKKLDIIKPCVSLSSHIYRNKKKIFSWPCLFRLLLLLSIVFCINPRYHAVLTVCIFSFAGILVLLLFSLLCFQAGWSMTFWVCYEQVRKQTGTSAFWQTELCKVSLLPVSPWNLSLSSASVSCLLLSQNLLWCFESESLLLFCRLHGLWCSGCLMKKSGK